MRISWDGSACSGGTLSRFQSRVLPPLPDAQMQTRGCKQTIIVGWDATVSGSRGLQVNPEKRSFLTGHRILSDCDKHSVRTAAAI